MNRFPSLIRSGVLASIFLLVASGLAGGADASAKEGPAPANGAAGFAVLHVDCAEFDAVGQRSAMAHVSVGGQLVVTVCSNGSTGYSWSAPVIADRSILAAAGAMNEAPASPMLGAAGTQTFAFEAVAAGTTTVDLSYDQPWDGGGKGAWTLHLEVIVGPQIATSVSIDCDVFGAEPEQAASVQVPVDGDLYVTLCSNASTGYSWSVPTVGDPAVVAITGGTEEGPASSWVGAPGTQTFAFHAIAAGSTTVGFSYDRPWTDGEKGAWTLTLDIVVG